MSGSRGGPQSTTSSETTKELFHLLPPFADASGVGQGCSRIESDHESRRDRRHPSGRRLAPPVGKTRRVSAEYIRLTLIRSAIVVKPKQPFMDSLHATDST